MRTRGGLFVAMCRSLPPISIIFFNSSLSVIPAMSLFSSVLKYGFPQNFLESRMTQGSLDQPAAPQSHHSALQSFLFQFQCRRAHQNELAEFISNFHNLVEAHATLVS